MDSWAVYQNVKCVYPLTQPFYFKDLSWEDNQTSMQKNVHTGLFTSMLFLKVESLKLPESSPLRNGVNYDMAIKWILCMNGK